MAAISRNQNVIPVPVSLKVIGIFGATFGLIGTLLVL